MSSNSVRVTFRPTVASDFAAWHEGPLPYRIKCITALVEDRVIGLGGLGYRPNEIPEVFAQFTDEARKYPVAIHRAGLMVMKMIEESRLPMVYATTDAQWPAGINWLTRLGMVRSGTEHGKAVFIWKR